MSTQEAPACTCFWTDPSTWLSAASLGYGGGYEPGSQMEQNPMCPVHPACCCEVSPPEFGGNLPDRECPTHGERAEPPRFRVKIEEGYGKPTTCKVWRDGQLVFDGVDRSVLIGRLRA